MQHFANLTPDPKDDNEIPGHTFDGLGCYIEEVCADKAGQLCTFYLYGSDTISVEHATSIAQSLFPNLKAIGVVNDLGWDSIIKFHEDTGDWCQKDLRDVFDVTPEEFACKLLVITPERSVRLAVEGLNKQASNTEKIRETAAA